MKQLFQQLPHPNFRKSIRKASQSVRTLTKAVPLDEYSPIHKVLHPVFTQYLLFSNNQIEPINRPYQNFHNRN